MNKFKFNNFKEYKIQLLYLVIGVLGFFLVLSFDGERRGASAVSGSYESLKTLAEVLSLVEINYVDDVDSEKLIDGAINGMLRNLDPHTSYLNKEMYKEMQVDTEGEFGGLGIEITSKNNWITVVSPMEDTPAFKAGIKAGDRIIKINGESTKSMNLNDAVTKMRGLKGTKITLTILRDETEKPFDVDLIRAIIKLKFIKEKTLEGNLGYIRIKGFSKTTTEDLKEAIKKMEKEKVSGYILDLRNNPGGLLNQAVSVAGSFLPKGQLVVYTKGKGQAQTINYKSEEDNPVLNTPIIVLVNGGSASASEIVAGALQDLKRAVILGTMSFGKGSVQTIIPLSDNSALRLTTARYYTPKGKVIQNNGITPDIIVEDKVMTAKAAGENTEAQMILREKDLERHLEEKKDKDSEVIKEKTPEHTPEKNNEGEGLPEVNGSAENIDDDPQLSRAVSLLKSWDVFQKNIMDKK